MHHTTWLSAIHTMQTPTCQPIVHPRLTRPEPQLPKTPQQPRQLLTPTLLLLLLL
jgi:hypothetical protein